MDGFTFFKNYYDALEELSEYDSKELVMKILKYVFKDIEPTFTEEEREQKLVWFGIVGSLTKSKENSHKKSTKKSTKKSVKKSS